MIFGLSVLNVVHQLPAIASGFPKLPSFPPDTVIISATFSFSSNYVDIPSTVHFPFLSVLLCMLRCVWLWDTIDCSPPGSSVHDISQARILEWVAISSSRESYQSRDRLMSPALAGRFLTTEPPGKGVVQLLSHVRLCDPTDCSAPGFSVLHHLLEFVQTCVHWVSDAIQPSHPLSSPFSPVFNLSQHQGVFKWVSSSHQVA